MVTVLLPWGFLFLPPPREVVFPKLESWVFLFVHVCCLFPLNVQSTVGCSWLWERGFGLCV